MREIIIDGKEVRVMGCPMALLYYKQEFGSDLVGDFMRMQTAAKSDPTQFDSITPLQAAWAMAKAGSPKPKEFPSFEKWVGGLESFDFSDQELAEKLAAEINHGFFRRSAERRQKQKG